MASAPVYTRFFDVDCWPRCSNVTHDSLLYETVGCMQVPTHHRYATARRRGSPLSSYAGHDSRKNSTPCYVGPRGGNALRIGLPCRVHDEGIKCVGDGPRIVPKQVMAKIGKYFYFRTRQRRAESSSAMLVDERILAAPEQ
jgi:hypothetical protein